MIAGDEVECLHQAYPRARHSDVPVHLHYLSEGKQTRPSKRLCFYEILSRFCSNFFVSCSSVGCKVGGQKSWQAKPWDSATIDCYSPHMSPDLVAEGLRTLEPLDNALVRVQVLFNGDGYKSCSTATRPYWTSSIGLSVCHDFCPRALVQPSRSPMEHPANADLFKR